jgi:flavin reductase (DIM6/NTAB) family NADH-FMN oxidoreductase RutF
MSLADTTRDAPVAFAPLVGFLAAMRTLPTGVSIIAAGNGLHRRGMTASAVCSISTEPPTLLASVNQGTDTHAQIRNTGCFSVNVIAAEHLELAKRFAGRHGIYGAERFAAGSWDILETGAPTLTDALATLDCRVAHELAWATHTIFLGTVVATRVRASGSALVYRAGAFIELPDVPVRPGP